MIEKDPNTFSLTTHQNHYHFLEINFPTNNIFKLHNKNLISYSGLQRMFHPVPEPTKCWHWSSDVVLSRYHQHNDANSPEPTSGRFWTRQPRADFNLEKSHASGIVSSLSLWQQQAYESHNKRDLFWKSEKITIMIISFYSLTNVRDLIS